MGGGDAGGVPGFFRLDEREARIQDALRVAEEARRRREVADYLYRFVRRMVRLGDEPAHIREALNEVWAVEVGYDPEGLAAKFIAPHPPTSSPTQAERGGAKPQRGAEVGLSSPRPEGEGQGVRVLLPPPFEWVDIPAGRVTLEAGGYVPKDGQTFDVATFAIAKYPITNAQFAKFIDVGGYWERRWWTDAGWMRRENDQWTKPRFWDDLEFNGADYPVVGVSWYEAVAFCTWLREISGVEVRLPTEQEWQRAAQGDDGREYPWENDFDTARCNTRGSGIGRTTPVTQYPNGASPYGVMDMAGNVWEWCLTEYPSGNTGLIGGVKRVVRGGSWDNGWLDARVAARECKHPSLRLNNLGFRVAFSY